MTKQEFLEGKPFEVLGQVLKFDSLGEVDRPLKGCITKLSSYRIEAYEYAANIDRISNTGVSVSAVWCGKIATGFMRFDSMKALSQVEPEVG
jgi:hypothetical protein